MDKTPAIKSVKIPKNLKLMEITLRELIGFFFCPYLDLTFHRVIKESLQSQVKLIYIIGFPILFLSLLVLGTKYFPIIYHMLLGRNDHPEGGVFLMVYIYIIIQTGITSILHLNELLKQNQPRFFWILLVFLVVCLFLYAIFANGHITILGNSMDLREALYRGFLGIYGLLAPIYIWVFAMKFNESQRDRRWFIWALAVLVALPFYVVGFYGKLEWIIYVLPIGVLLALLISFKSIAKLVLRIFLPAR